MNSNRGNNRRRSRGSNRSQSGSQLNRIDSRARGNAPQLLDKYRKLAQDASLNGDRVQAEYYLQFADHYFRVVADSRAPRDDYRGQRNDRDGEGADEDAEFDRGNRRPFEERDEQPEGIGEEQPARDGSADFEPADNPFVRDNRQQRSRSRDDRKPRRPRDEERSADARADQLESSTIDASVLPSAILSSSASSAEGESEPEAPVEAPKPRRRTRKAKADDGEALENVNG